MATALVSLLTGRPVRSDLAMTGEISLSGRVLPVGGIKEKVLAAHRAGLRTVLLPRRNEKNLLEDVPAVVRQSLTVHLADTVSDVLTVALEPARSTGAGSSPGVKSAPFSADLVRPRQVARDSAKIESS